MHTLPHSLTFSKNELNIELAQGQPAFVLPTIFVSLFFRRTKIIVSLLRRKNDGRHGGKDFIKGLAGGYARLPTAASKQVGQTTQEGAEILVGSNGSSFADLTRGGAARLYGA